VRIGDNDKTFAELNRSLTRHCNLLAMLRTEPIFDPIWGDSRYKDILKKINIGE